MRPALPTAPTGRGVRRRVNREILPSLPQSFTVGAFSGREETKDYNDRKNRGKRMNILHWLLRPIRRLRRYDKLGGPGRRELRKQRLHPLENPASHIEGMLAAAGMTVARHRPIRRVRAVGLLHRGAHRGGHRNGSGFVPTSPASAFQAYLPPPATPVVFRAVCP